MARTEADGSAFVRRCGPCNREDHRSCQGRPDGPPGRLCRCPQCYLAEAERQWDAARVRQDAQARLRLVIWGDVMRTARAEARSRKRPKRGPVPAWCAGCGKPCTTARRDRRGTWCSAACKMRHARRRWAGQPAEAEPAGPGQAIPAPAPAADRAVQRRTAPSEAITAATAPHPPGQAADTRPAWLRARQDAATLAPW